jgi:CBS domain containing-hemolysin-like protein
MTTVIWDLLGVLGIFIAASLFTFLESTLTAMPEARAHRLAADAEHPNPRAKRWVAERARILATLLLLRTVVRVTGAWRALLFGRAVAEGNNALVVASATFAVLLILEAPARVLGNRLTDRLALTALMLLRPFEILLTPLSVPLSPIFRRVGAQVSEAEQLVEGVKARIEQKEREGTLEKASHELLHSVLEFTEVTVKELMVPRTQVFGIELDTPIAEVLKLVGDSGHSRVPVYRDNIDSIVGTLFVKDLLKCMENPATAKDASLSKIIRRPPFFCAETERASRLLSDMQNRHVHLTVVVDEFGGTSGIVTLEDVIECIVGDIQDEHDDEHSPFVRIDDQRVVADAAVSISEASDYLGVEIPYDGDYESLGGFVTNLAGRVPEVGARLSWRDLCFVIKEGDEKHVARIEIEKVPPQERKTAPPTAAAAD